MREVGCYTADNPLIDVTSLVFNDVDDDDLNRESNDPPKMPDISGVKPTRSHRRLTDSFFKLVGKERVPQIIDDPTFPVSVLSGGRKVAGWGLREECVPRLLFETGGRIFEVTGLTLGDWVNRGLTREATAVSKGSHGRRVKFFRFSTDTATWHMAHRLRCRATRSCLMCPHRPPLGIAHSTKRWCSHSSPAPPCVQPGPQSLSAPPPNRCAIRH
jgi:hypothetical protein